MTHDYLISLIRTAVPAGVGALLAWLASQAGSSSTPTRPPPSPLVWSYGRWAATTASSGWPRHGGRGWASCWARRPRPDMRCRPGREALMDRTQVRTLTGTPPHCPWCCRRRGTGRILSGPSTPPRRKQLTTSSSSSSFSHSASDLITPAPCTAPRTSPWPLRNAPPR